MPWPSRLFFVLAVAIAVVGVASGTACTRSGKPATVPPTIPPLSMLYVNPHTGNDTTGNGSQTDPYKSLTKAIAVVVAAKSVSSTGVSIDLAAGDYDAATGEKFPIVVPTSVSLNGHGYGIGPQSGTFLDGAGEDKIYERVAGAPARSYFTTLEISAPADVSLSSVYIGAAKLRLPNASAAYASTDVLGTLSASEAAFDAGTVSASPKVNGVLVASGSFSCASCAIHGNTYGIGALSVPRPPSAPTPSPSPSSPSGSGSGSPSSPTPPPAGGPTVELSHASGDATIDAKVVDILTDGSANVTAAGERFLRGSYAYEDTMPPVKSATLRGALDFGGGAGGSGGLNTLIGARTTEISIERSGVTAVALDDTWNPKQQGANNGGVYPKTITFGSNTQGRNVQIGSLATGSTVTVGPAPVPTASPTIGPSFSPSPSASPSDSLQR